MAIGDPSTDDDHHDPNATKRDMTPREHRQAYWRTNVRYLAILLTVWFAVSYGCGILFVDALDQLSIGGFRLGFWFAQQGSIYVFVALIFVYVWLMNRLDRRYGLDERDEPPADVLVGRHDREGDDP